MFGCEPESPISQIVQAELTETLSDGSTVTKPQRAKGSSWTLANTTVSSEDTVRMRTQGIPRYNTPLLQVLYRHWSVDIIHDLVYMCDRQPYRPLAGSLYLLTDIYYLHLHIILLTSSLVCCR